MFAVVDSLHEHTGLAKDQLATLIALLLCYPLGIVYSTLPRPWMRHIMNIVFGPLLCVAVLGPLQWLHPAFTALVVYVAMHVVPRRHITLTTFVFTMLYLTGIHVYRAYVDYLGWTLDISGSQMVLTLKLTSLAASFADGEPGREPPKSEYMKRHAVREMPTLLQYFGFVFYFPGFLTGPVLMYNDYVASVERHVPPFSTLAPALTRFVQALVWVPMLLYADWSMKFLTEPAKLSQLSFLSAIVWICVVGTLARSRYYFGWIVSEGGAIASGAAYNPKTNDHTLLVNVYPLKVETSADFRELTTMWNTSASNWLKYAIYLRVPAAYRQFVTYFLSAAWHGLVYPGYLITFLGVSVAQTVNKQWTAWRGDRYEQALSHGVGRAACVVLTMVTGNLLAASFLLLSWERSIAFYRHIYYLPFTAIVAAFVFFSVLGLVARPSRRESKSKSTATSEAAPSAGSATSSSKKQD